MYRVPSLFLEGQTLRPPVCYFCGLRMQSLEAKKTPGWIELESCL